MAKLTDENGFVLYFELLQPDTSDPEHTYYPMRFTLLLNNEPVLNEKVLRRDCEYSCKGFPGGFAGEEIDNFSLIKDLEEVYKSKKMKLWSAFPHEDIEIAIYPGLFPYLDEENKEYFTLIFSPCLCRFKDVNICGISPISFIMTPSEKE